MLEDQADQRSEYVVEEGEECEKGLGYVEHILLIVRHWCRSDQDDLSEEKELASSREGRGISLT